MNDAYSPCKELLLKTAVMWCIDPIALNPKPRAPKLRMEVENHKDSGFGDH